MNKGQLQLPKKSTSHCWNIQMSKIPEATYSTAYYLNSQNEGIQTDVCFDL